MDATLLFPWQAVAVPVAYGLLALLALYAAVQFASSLGQGRMVTALGRGSLRSGLLLGFTMIGALPVLALGILLAHKSADERLDRVSMRMASSVDAFAASVDDFFDKHKSGMTSSAAAISSLGRFDKELMTRWLMLYHNVYGDYLTMLHADADGRMVTATSNLSGFLEVRPDLAELDISDRDYFRGAKRSGETYVTDAFRGRGAGLDPIVAISAPLENSAGEFVGIIEGSLDLGAFARIERQRMAMVGASVILLDPQDRVIFASESAMLAPLEKMTAAPFHVAGRSAADATFSYEDGATAAQYLAAVATTRDGWRAYVTVPVTAIREQILTDYRTSALTVLLSIAAAALLVAAIVRRVMFSIEDMNSAMTRFRLDGTGATIRTPLSTFSEFKPVYAEMRQRAEALKRAYQHLRDSQAAGDRLRSELDREVTEREHEIEKRTAELREAHDRLADLSKLDPLTGIANRREFEAFRDRVLRLATRDDLSIAIVLVDVDYFKIFNDRLGHQAGDECLKTVAKTLSQCAARPLDLVARYGGEEFVAVLGGSTVMDALVVADRMRRAVEALAIEHPASSQDQVSVSCGVAAGRPRDGANPEEMLGAADEALYYAKAAGRNCVVFQKDGEFVTFDNDEIDLGETNVLSILAARRR